MDKRIKKAFDLLSKNYKQKILLHELAAKFKLSPFHFQRLFKKEMNETPAACLKRIRLERAAHMARVSGVSLSHIARECGFSSPATFSRAFSKQFGVSPTVLQKLPSEKINLPANADSYTLKAEIVNFPGATLFYSLTSIYHPDLLKSFEAAASYCELEGIPYQKDKRYGVFTHTVFHGPKESLNYYAGIPLLGEGPEDRVFSIPKGKYVSFITDSSYAHFRDILMAFKVEWMDKMNYTINGLFGFEEVFPENKAAHYPRFRRKVYIPIRAKS